jgi:phage terminase large subunit GpA-like protein
VLPSLLRLTVGELAAKSKTADAETQAVARFLLQRINKRDHKALVRYITEAGHVDELRPAFEEYKRTETTALASIVKTAGGTMTTAALVAALFVVQSVAAGEPLRMKFTEHRTLAQTRHDLDNDDGAWIATQVGELTDEKIVTTVSGWAEANRYLPKQVTSMPGYYSFEVAPFLREIADCMSVDSPVREFDFMKGAQIGATVGILENAIGYAIDHIKSAPIMLLTADAELAKLRVEGYITPMLQHSGLSHLIRSADENNTRKTGKTDKRIEWAGGGFLVPFGARNADKLRSISIQWLLEDECDAYPSIIGKDGDPQKLAEARTKSYQQTRKIARISTPLIKGSSRIAAGFERGDQRYYYVPCKSCKRHQVLRFKGQNDETGEAWGLVWETDEQGALVPGSTRYLCQFCGHPHTNADKSYLLPAGEWRPTSKPRDPEHRSYHLSALYSPVGMFDWDALVRDWLEAWDVEQNAPRNVGALQEFYNNNLGEPFEIRGSKVRFVSVSAHRRAEYRLGQVPNKFAAAHSGSSINFLTCTVDVHKNNLAVSVIAWARDLRSYVIDYWRFETKNDEDDCSELSSPVWNRLRDLIEKKTYTADDGTEYRIALTLVDAGYANDTVSTFCSDYVSGVYPILGRDRPAKNQTIKEFAEFKTQSGTTGYRVLVDHYKDRLAPVLRREWHKESGMQYPFHFNAPVDLSDKQLKELTVESRREKIDDNGNAAHYWHRPGTARNELWDLLVYGHASVEIMAWNICVQYFALETVDWPKFWDYAALSENDALFGRVAPKE